MKHITFPVGLPEDLYGDIREAAQATSLSMADAIRQSIKLGLPTLRKRLATTGRITNVDPLPKRVLDRLYQEREDDLESIRTFVAAQPKDAQ